MLVNMPLLAVTLANALIVLLEITLAPEILPLTLPAVTILEPVMLPPTDSRPPANILPLVMFPVAEINVSITTLP